MLLLKHFALERDFERRRRRREKKSAHNDCSNHVWMQHTEIWIVACLCKCMAKCLSWIYQWIKVWWWVKFVIWRSVAAWCNSMGLWVFICPCYFRADTDFNRVWVVCSITQAWSTFDYGTPVVVPLDNSRTWSPYLNTIIVKISYVNITTLWINSYTSCMIELPPTSAKSTPRFKKWILCLIRRSRR